MSEALGALIADTQMSLSHSFVANAGFRFLVAGKSAEALTSATELPRKQVHGIHLRVPRQKNEAEI